MTWQAGHHTPRMTCFSINYHPRQLEICHARGWHEISMTNWLITGIPPKTNMEPENGPLEKEIPIGNHHFQVPC